MNRTQTKQTAQNELLSAMQVAFEPTVSDELRDEMSRQMARVETLFGYEPLSWQRGC